ncbi:MAG: hypothetical protein ABIR32_16630 [Ilumatobacteraceae bacterium]
MDAHHQHWGGGSAAAANTAHGRGAHPLAHAVSLSGIGAVAPCPTQAESATKLMTAAMSDLDRQLDAAMLDWDAVRLVTIRLGPADEGLASWNAIIHDQIDQP